MTDTHEHLRALFQHAAAWRYHAQQLYHFSVTQMLEWPSLTCDWIPDKKVVFEDRDYTLQYIAVGTQALPGSQNYVNIFELAIPMESDYVEDYYSGLDGVEEQPKGHQYAEIRGHSRVDQLLMMESQVLKLSAMPQSSNLLAVKMTNGYVSIFDIEKRPKFTEDASSMNPDVRLRGHRKAGFGLAWSPTALGVIASGGDDHLVCTWDIEGGVGADGSAGGDEGNGRPAEVKPLQTLSGHTDIVHGVAWHATQEHLLGSVGEDRSFILWDTRTASAAQTVEVAHRGPAYGIDFHPVAAYQFATCGGDRLGKLWDLRKLSTPAHTLVYHSHDVVNVKWSPFSDTVLATSGSDRRVVMWDMQKINEPHSDEVDEYAPPELSFVHTGHLSRILDMAWNPGLEDEWLMASVDMTNTVQIYKPSRDIVYDFIAPDVFDVDNADA